MLIDQYPGRSVLMLNLVQDELFKLDQIDKLSDSPHLFSHLKMV